MTTTVIIIIMVMIIVNESSVHALHCVYQMVENGQIRAIKSELNGPWSLKSSSTTRKLENTTRKLFTINHFIPFPFFSFFIL